jgi:hypothetical protein
MWHTNKETFLLCCVKLFFSDFSHRLDVQNNYNVSEVDSTSVFRWQGDKSPVGPPGQASLKPA